MSIRALRACTVQSMRQDHLMTTTKLTKSETLALQLIADGLCSERRNIGAYGRLQSKALIVWCVETRKASATGWKLTTEGKARLGEQAAVCQAAAPKYLSR